MVVDMMMMMMVILTRTMMTKSVVTPTHDCASMTTPQEESHIMDRTMTIPQILTFDFVIVSSLRLLLLLLVVVVVVVLVLVVSAVFVLPKIDSVSEGYHGCRWCTLANNHLLVWDQSSFLISFLKSVAPSFNPPGQRSSVQC